MKIHNKKKIIYYKKFQAFKFEKKINFFNNVDNTLIKNANLILDGKIKFFHYHWKEVGNPPDWFRNPFNGKISNFSELHWTKINEFNKELGDIKNLWDLSRLEFLGTLSIAYKYTKDQKYLDGMNELLSDWCKKNPLYFGPNWKCAQEASLRILNVYVANEIISHSDYSDDLISTFSFHLERIYPTTIYAKAQNNNHGISEGLALYLIGGALYDSTKKTKYLLLHKKGLQLIENRVFKLIMDDGSFSQYSIVYHRMILDQFSILEFFRQKNGYKKFSRNFYKKVKLAFNWYVNMIDEKSGNAPNYGANDGTYLFNYNLAEYRDFRPTISLFSSIFKIPIKKELFIEHILHSVLKIENPVYIDHIQKLSGNFEGGLIKLSKKNESLYFRLPRFIFRPSHSDGLQVDIWNNGINWIRDLGTFSYALKNDDLDRFSGTCGHNTACFDGLNQMPRFSRFLFYEWIKPNHVNFNISNATAESSYFDKRKNFHSRKIEKISRGWMIHDFFKGNFNYGELRFHLYPCKWILEKGSLVGNECTISVKSNKPNSMILTEANESLYYMKKKKIPTFLVRFEENSEIKTTISFS